MPRAISESVTPNDAAPYVWGRLTDKQRQTMLTLFDAENSTVFSGCKFHLSTARALVEMGLCEFFKDKYTLTNVGRVVTAEAILSGEVEV